MSFSIFNEVIIDASRNIANVGIITAQDFRKADGSSLGGLTVKNLEGIGGGPKVPEVVNVNTITFDANSGFNITDEGNGEVFVDLGSTFNPWYVDGQPTLKADGEEPLKIVAGNGINITTVPTISGVNTCKAIELSVGSIDALPDDEISGGYIISNPKVLIHDVSVPAGSNCAVYGPEVTVGDTTVITVEDGGALLIN